jgi:hypothetical protein
MENYIQDCHSKCSTQQDAFHQQTWLQWEKNTDKVLQLSRDLFAETWTLCRVDQKCLEVLRCGAREGWRKSIGPIV